MSPHTRHTRWPLRLLATVVLTGLLLAPATPAQAASFTESHSQYKDPLGIWDAGLRVHMTFGYRSLTHRRIQGTSLTLRARCDFMEADAFTRVHVRMKTTRTVNRYPAYFDCHGHPKSRFHMTLHGRRARVDVWAHARRNGAPDINYHLVFHVCRNGGC
jgi:hypothetical protein